MKIEYDKWYFYFETKSGWHFCPFNWIDIPKYRYWGYEDLYYDGPKPSFGFWFFNVTWGYV